MSRIYSAKLDDDEFGDLFTVNEWLSEVKNIWCSNYDGSGYWVKDGYVSNDEVFSSEPEDATHVIWYNK